MDEILSFFRDNAWFFSALVLAIGGARYYLKTHDIERRYEDCKSERDKCRHVCAALEKELDRIKSVSVFRHWLYLQGDPKPRAPICPQCWSDGKITRMFRGAGRYSDIIRYECPGHRVGIEVNIMEQRELLKRLGDNIPPR